MIGEPLCPRHFRRLDPADLRLPADLSSTFFGGAWCSCPDAVTFSDVEGVNFYKDDNAFFKMYDWRPVPTINSRFPSGQAIQTSEQRNRYELVSGTHGRSGEQIDVWSAVWGPVSWRRRVFHNPAFDKSTGKIDKNVVAYWRDHSDLLEYLKRNWSTVERPELKDNLYFFAGDADTYFSATTPPWSWKPG